MNRRHEPAALRPRARAWITHAWMRSTSQNPSVSIFYRATPACSLTPVSRTPSQQDDTLEYQFKTCYARILDAKGKFTEAALRYYDLSQTKIGLVMGAGKQVGEADLAVALTSAITCAILAAAGPQLHLLRNAPIISRRNFSTREGQTEARKEMFDVETPNFSHS